LVQSVFSELMHILDVLWMLDQDTLDSKELENTNKQATFQIQDSTIFFSYEKVNN
jgi:hypothetical protein